MNNLYYFDLATQHKESLCDPLYHTIVDRQVIPSLAGENNELTEANARVIRYISTLETLFEEMHYTVNDKPVEDVLLLMMDEIDKKGMNYCAFCQYFNVHNINYSIFEKGLEREEKLEVLKFIIKPYIETRHKMYLSHGYSDIVLQVMSDNYSHKRKGTYGSNKIAEQLKQLSIPDLANADTPDFGKDCFYLLSDKTGKRLFKTFAAQYGVRLTDEGKETEKYPDALIKIGADWYIVEQKNMKETGGGQDKQTLEITNFIDRQPEFERLHYITYIDGIYFNRIKNDAKAKMFHQYNDIVTVLQKHTQNYFVNSFAFEQLMKDQLANVQ